MARRWTEHELLIAMNLYCRLPFGQLRHGNPLVVAVAERLKRTPSSVSMKLCNLASFDPALQARGVSGLKGASRSDRAVWNAYHADWSAMSAQSEAAFKRLMAGHHVAADEDEELSLPEGPSTRQVTADARQHQRFFRRTVLASYNQRCALTGLAVPALLVASHIIPWSQDEHRRADPTNGLCLNALHDRAFDRHLITFDEDLRLVVSRDLKSRELPEFHAATFTHLEGTPLRLPERFQPDPAALAAHRNTFAA